MSLSGGGRGGKRPGAEARSLVLIKVKNAARWKRITYMISPPQPRGDRVQVTHLCELIGDGDEGQQVSPQLKSG